jgi:drug/metabolite transporter superfamily protein YnfA
MVEIFFLARHIPFWAVPLIVLGGEFAYLFWLRKKKKSAALCVFVALLGLFAVIFYVWAGGPEKSVKVIKKMYREMN